jgi:hypothetical protein
MNRINKLFLFGLLIVGSCELLSGDELYLALTKGEVSADLRAFYFNGDRDNRTDREALAIGGIVKYQSSSYYGFSTGAAFYVSDDTLHKGYETAQKGSLENGGDINLVTRNVAGNTEMVNFRDGSSINSLAEAYLEYNIGKTSIKFGRQRLHTPLLNDYYNRFLPNTFEATLVKNIDIPNTELLGIYVTRWKYKATDTFIGITEGLADPSIDSDVMVVGAKNSSIPKTKVELYYYIVPDLMNTLYTQVDNKIKAGGFSISSALQYLNQKEDGKEMLGKLDSYLFGAKVKVSYGNFSLKGMYDMIGNYTIRGSGTDYHTIGWSQFINFTDIQIDGEALNAGAVSYGLVAGYNFTNSIKSALKYVRIDQDLQKQADGNTPNIRPSSDEYNLDIKYKINKVSKLRVRFAYIDYEPTHKNEFDEVNTRVIYDYKFSIKG